MPVGRTPGVLQRWSPNLLRVLSVILFIVLWELGWRTQVLDPRFYSGPSLIMAAGREVVADHDLLVHVRVTGTQLAVGWLIGSSLAIVLGVLIGLKSMLRKMLDPILMALYVMPRLAIYPVLVVWLGIGMGSKVAMVAIGSFFLAIINIVAGVRNIPPILTSVARSFDLSAVQRFWKITVPAAAPSIFTGLRHGLSQGVIAVITAEMYLSLEGVGNLVMRYGQAMRTDHLLFLVLLTATATYTLIKTMTALEGVFAARSGLAR